jgi:hypothetical protein
MTAPKRGDQAGPFRAQAAYTIAQLAQFAGLSRFVLRGLLESSGVKFIRSGRTLLVPLAEIEEKLPKLWKSFWLLEGARLARGAGAAPGETGARGRSEPPSPGFLAIRREIPGSRRGSE